MNAHWIPRLRALAAAALLQGSLPGKTDDLALVPIAAVWRWAPALTPAGPLPADWSAPGFPDAPWASAPSGFAGDPGGAEATVLSPQPFTHAVCFRHRFPVADPTRVAWLILRVDWTGGFVAYLNGVEIARRHLEGPPGEPVPFDALPAPRTKGLAEEWDASAALPHLRAGDNVLALQWHPSPGQYTSGLVPELLANFTRGPFVQNTTPTTQTLVWRTLAPADTTVDFGETPALGRRAFNPALTRHHVALLTNLAPDTLYFYQVRSRADLREAVSPLLQFRTFKTAGPLSFMVAADMGSGRLPQYQVADILRSGHPDLVLVPGDTVYPTFQEALADARFFSIYRRQMTSTPFFVVAGNHDGFYGASPDFFTAFVTPTNSTPLAVHAVERTGPGHYYSFDHGEAHFVGLHAPIFYPGHEWRPDSAQLRWLAADLAATTRPWKILFLHLPLMTSGPHGRDDYNKNGQPDSLELAELLFPVARQFGVQVIFSAHDHAYERFHPVDGILCVVSAGGGGSLYSQSTYHPASAQFHRRWHATHVRIQGSSLHLRALDFHGTVFDECFLERVPPPPPDPVPTTAWHTPDFAPDAPDDGDGNRLGQRFHFAGSPLPTAPGDFSNLGRAWLNRDHAHLYLGLEAVMLPRGATLYLFLETPALPGVHTLAHLGNNLLDPSSQGADGLDFLGNLAFDHFRPNVACLLGDEYADGQFRSFTRTNLLAASSPPVTPDTHLALDTGQGVFWLDDTFSDFPGARLQQFNRSPQTEPAPGEQNADFIQIALPLRPLGLSGGETLRLGAVVGANAFSTNPASPAGTLDRSFLGAHLQGSGPEPVRLTGLPFVLGPDLDPDADGLLLDDELARGTDPNHPDTDRDGLPDGWEVTHGLAPLSPHGHDGADGDPDADGALNHAEFIAGTHPHNPRSALRLSARRAPNRRLELRWSAVPGRRYQLESASHLDHPFTPFLPETDPRVAAGPEEVVLIPWPAEASPPRWYRVRVWP